MFIPMKNLEEFHNTFTPEQIKDSLGDTIDRRQNLIYEEAQEVSDALLHLENTYYGMTSSTMEESLEEVAKELADLLYVVFGTAQVLNIPLEEVFDAVHKSNMDKVWDDGEVHYNEWGKVMKPPTYSPPDLSFIHGNRF